MNRETYTVIVSIRHAQEKISTIEGYCGVGRFVYDISSPAYKETLISWRCSPPMLRTRLKEFFEQEDLASQREIDRWKRVNKLKLKTMADYVTRDEVATFQTKMENFIRIAFRIEASRIY